MYSTTKREYYYWGYWGPAVTRKHLLSGAFTFFVVLPVLIVLALLLIAVLLVAIAVPPVGLAILAKGNS